MYSPHASPASPNATSPDKQRKDLLTAEEALQVSTKNSCSFLVPDIFHYFGISIYYIT